MNFNKGDIVRLRSGGPEMTVEKVGERAMIGGQAVWCVWSENVKGQQMVKRDTFEPESLTVEEAYSQPGGSA